jgi:ABC-type Fe3+/spermidine/putrescine transport system ATPase subunit
LSAADDGGYRPGEAVAVGIRPERIGFDAAAENRFEGTLAAGEYLGDRTDWQVHVAGGTFTVAEPAGGGERRRTGDKVTLGFAAEALLRLEAPPRAAAGR